MIYYCTGKNKYKLRRMIDMSNKVMKTNSLQKKWNKPLVFTVSASQIKQHIQVFARSVVPCLPLSR